MAGEVIPDRAAKDTAAKSLAQKHFAIEAGLKHIFRITGSADAEARAAEPIKLLEVNEATVPSGIMPLHFGPSPASGVPFSSVIIEVTPGEYDKIITKETALPSGWVISEELPKVG